MTLLTEVMTRPLDPGYAAAAERRRLSAQGAAASGPHAGVRGRSPLALAVLVVVGVLLATAFGQARQTRPANVVGRERLVSEITRRDDEATAMQRSNADLAVRIEVERTRQLQAQAQGGLADQVARLGLVTGAVEATGPGVVVTVQDAVSAAAVDGGTPRADGQSEDGRVLDQDVQLVVNGLWAAGAEAISINGQRLTALSAIRSAGQAILVDYRPLAPPYRVSAIGDPATLPARFSDGGGGRDLQYLKDNFGIRYDVTSSQALLLPASSSLTTRRAKALVPSTPTSLPGSGQGTASSPPSGPATAESPTARTPLDQQETP